jgi:hypothetical protein
MGAIDFIVTGDPEPSKAKKGFELAPLDTRSQTKIEAITPLPTFSDEDDPAISQIEECCHHWRAGRVKPYWVALNEPKCDTSPCSLSSFFGSP